MLKDIVELINNDKENAVLKVKDGKMMELICLGFIGDETMFRITKGNNHTCTIWKNTNGMTHYFSFFWGDGGHTIVSDSVRKMGNLIYECLEKDFGINMSGDVDHIKKTLGCNDFSKRNLSLKVMYWRDTPIDICVHRDGVFYKRFYNLTEFNNHFTEYSLVCKQKGYSSQTGCNVDIYVATPNN